MDATYFIKTNTIEISPNADVTHLLFLHALIVSVPFPDTVM